jgi:hypothetical protein
MVKFTPYSDIQQLAFVRQLKTLTPVQLLTVLVFLQLQQAPNRGNLIQRILSA